ncbi:helix-turn-helix domain-containing protein [Streptomyces sp. AP-93]|uniref:helix-turn-helix domain-containing protein n=1 Tax=Streptomyces sp. AP-93 TaxID=2929048 RepID=UPI001FAF479C|nr:helix-turn-helix domain-containing protein [Streptomyces sp. AP-93]MCJ0867992.1 helix-turn-helix domain-containing protein [Streptomyces sp. AP-93]
MQKKRPRAERYVKICNELAQHSTLSLTAIGLSVYIQSLPDGTDVSIRALKRHFPEGGTRIAAALRELEAAGYLARTRVRLPSGHIVTQTVSYNVPLDQWEQQPPQQAQEQDREQVPPPVLALVPVPAEEPDPEPDPDPDPAPCPSPEPAPAAAPAAGGEAVPLSTPPAEAPPQQASAPEPRQAPAPVGPLPERHRESADLLARLRLRDPRLTLSERDVARLAPALTGWLELGLNRAAVSATLAGGLPDGPIQSAAGLLAYRLRELRPPRLPQRPAGGVRPPDMVIHPFQTCDDCERVFRAPAPGHCNSCSATRAANAA